MTTVKIGCITEKRPIRKASEAISDKAPDDCPEGLVCYTEKEHAPIEQAFAHLIKIERWARLAEKACETSEQTQASEQTPARDEH